MTQDEFSLPLIECIRHIGRILAYQDQHAGVVHRGTHEGATEKLNELNMLRKELPRYIAKLSDDDAAQVVKRYPWALNL